MAMKTYNFYLTDVQIKTLKEINKKNGLPLCDILGVRLMNIGRNMKRKREVNSMIFLTQPSNKWYVSLF